ncbi:MAG: flavodoxin family protein [Candidatus Helarchaeota archaeon]
MRILICYHSETGNTELVAKNIAKGFENEDLTILPAKDVDPASINSYDIVFLGTGVYAGGVGKSLSNLIKLITEFPKKVALFYTHTNPDPAYHGKAFKKIKKILEKNNVDIIGQFDCIGENKNKKITEMLIKMSPELKSGIESAIGHPDSKDLEDATNFAKSILTKL